MRPIDLQKRLEDQPFQPFRIHLTDGTVIDVERPGMVIVGIATAVLPTEYKVDTDGARVAADFRTINLRQIVQFSDARPKTNGHRRRKR